MADSNRKLAYSYTKKLEGIKTLLSSTRPNSELVRALKLPEIKDCSAFQNFDSSVKEEFYYFVIKTTDSLLLIAEKKSQDNSAEPSHKNFDKSTQLRALNQASQLWSNADRDDKATWTDTKDVIAFLVEKGFSQTLAERGASIVFPHNKQNKYLQDDAYSNMKS